ncbi:MULTISPECIES: SDR family NAD(P)-dependent oxidoreductase [Pseudomonas aeruginosa group]|uniref:SDR family NAD(P)-dependent oxidoreductase n=1 Tax=Pseudomonas aeruginosa group TaxID=136841 RepID=UPI00071B68F6|nr:MULTISPECIES: SDR family oxidoreductase [Pseudomonas aeruginosa group]KSC37546.1 short-chain dehydrogenase [Pseudomonas paraeruginosa]KSL13474.1 short-chain dehydrogenase [Pseudomonas aeruginosa]MBH8714000.1 SDR family oxidoreductase [Pseudomonas aeruginosa]MBI8116991.1 SDR family oxidoreductase [Pseudomonas aeruginosa]OKR54690.1 short-chain dehydrogenase [Pseudomonas aeruginosa]
MSEFNERFAVVTGASSGIGLQLTETLLAQGATVLAMARHTQPPEALQAHQGERLHWLAGDVTCERDLAALAARAASIGAVDYLVPNAGIARLADGLDSQAFEQQWRVNGAGALNTFAVLSQQMRTPASVVFIGTFLTQVTFPGLAAYIASKTALIAQARTLAMEWAGKGVRINVVSPGPTATPIWHSLGLSGDQVESVTRDINLRLVDGSFLSPQEIVDVVTFLLSTKSAGLYGQELIVDKGYGLR